MVLKEALDYTFYLKNGEHSLKKVIKICPWRIQFVVESATKSSDDVSQSFAHLSYSI
jgi:hypothetical protein